MLRCQALTEDWSAELEVMPSVPAAVGFGSDVTYVAVAARATRNVRHEVPALAAGIAGLPSVDRVVMLLPSYARVVPDDDKPTAQHPWEPGHLARRHDAGDMEVRHMTSVVDINLLLRLTRVGMYERSLHDDGSYAFTPMWIEANVDSYIAEHFWLSLDGIVAKVRPDDRLLFVDKMLHTIGAVMALGLERFDLAGAGDMLATLVEVAGIGEL